MTKEKPWSHFFLAHHHQSTQWLSLHSNKMMNISHHLPTAASLLDGPTITTKALLVTVVAPRKFFTQRIPDEEWVDGNEEQVETKLGDDSSVATDATTASVCVSINNREIARVEEGLYVRKESEDDSDEENSKIISQDSQDDIPITAEEAAAITAIGTDLDEQEVNVEELLRIAIQSLLEERHLLNVPTYSEVMDKQEVITKISAQSLFSDHDLRIKEVTAWIRMDVMARPASLGMIIERLERIGIGSQVGTICIYHAELCKTASPYAHLPKQNDDEFDEENEIGNDTNHTRETHTSTEDEEKERQERMIEEARKEWKNAATRLRIEKVREQIVEQAALSFDFVALLAVASILAGIGLITNNTVVIVAR